MDKESRILILEERNKQNDLTFSFVKSIGLIISGLILFTLIFGYFTMYVFDQNFLDANELTDLFGDLGNVLLFSIGICSLNILGLLLFSKGQKIGLFFYVFTNCVFACFFGAWAILEIEFFAIILFLFFVSFSILVGFYGSRKIKWGKELKSFMN